jgi:hypothetical protein
MVDGDQGIATRSEDTARPAVASGTVAPDYASPLVGWRLWLVVADGGYLWLESLLYAIRWSPRRALDARCVPHRRCYLCNQAEVDAALTHSAPDEACECGIYAAASPDTLAPYLDSTYPGGSAVERVLGRVRLWGKVVECERGWRGEHAYPDRIYVPCRPPAEHNPQNALEIAAGLRDYGIPVSLLRLADDARPHRREPRCGDATTNTAACPTVGIPRATQAARCTDTRLMQPAAVRAPKAPTG